MDALRHELKAEMKASEASLTRRVLGIVAALNGSLFALLKLT